MSRFTPLRRLVSCLDGQRIPLNAEERSSRQGDVPYWGAGSIVDYVNEPIFNEELVLLGEDGAPFFDNTRPVAFHIDEPVWVNNHIHALRPGSQVEGRFLTYALNVTDFSAYINGSTRDKLTQEQMMGITVPLPPLDVQRRITDFLDDQVTRIDNTINARKQLMALGVAQHLAWLSDEYESLSGQWGAPPLRYFLMSIGQGWSPQCDDRPPSENEWGVLRAGACNGGVFHPDDRKTLQEGLAPRLEYQVKTGDLLVNRASGSLELIGNATVVGENLQPRTLLCDKIYRLTLGHQLLPLFVASMWPAPPVRESLLLGVSGAGGMANSLPSEAIKSVRIPAAPIRSQEAWLDGFRAKRETLETLDRGGTRFIELLQELKRSLITSAVTGEFDVTTADGTGVQV